MSNSVIVILVEVINLLNLANITGGDTSQLMFDFIALGVVADFDDYFIEIYKHSKWNPLTSLSLTFEHTVKPKRELPTV